jgi:uncharacterized lipoprotein YehR (DUF1307 family)
LIVYQSTGESEVDQESEKLLEAVKAQLRELEGITEKIRASDGEEAKRLVAQVRAQIEAMKKALAKIRESNDI